MAASSNNTSNISIPIKGMNSDLAQLNTDQSVYSFALNAITEGFWEGNSGFLSNEQSNVLDVVFPEGYQVVGFKEIHEQNRVLYILTDPLTGHTQVGEVINARYKNRTDHISNVSCDPCDYTGHEITPLEQQEELPYNQYLIISPFYNTQGIDCSGININYPIDIEYKVTSCGVNIYFTDDLNERRFLYFDYSVSNDPTSPLVLQDRFKFQTGTTGTPDCPQPVYINEIDCTKIKVHPNYQHPCVQFIDFVNGGNLKAGTYQVLICYSDIYGNPISNYFPASATIPLWSKQITFETNYETPKALKFKIDHLKTDSIFQFYNVVIAQTIEQFTQFILIGTFSTTQVTYTYTGFEKTSKVLSAQEVFFRRPFYKTARGVTTANNYLFFTGVNEYPLLNLQPVANKIKLQWETVAVKEGSYRDPHSTFFFKTYQRDEIYSFGIVFEYDNGRETCAFHIPGREATPADLVIVDPSNQDIVTGLTCDELIKCINGLNIRVSYAPPGTDPANPCNNAPNNSHQCNRAAFFVIVNGVNVGLANINNDGNTSYCGGVYPDPVPGDIGGPRTTSLSLTQSQIVAAAQASADGSLTINLDCATPTCGCHTEAAWIRITNSAGQVLFDGCNNSFKIWPCNQNIPIWQVYNTATLVGGDYEYSELCEDSKCWEYGDFAYWESTETYPQVPEVWGNLCGKPIRHHKFPDSNVTHIHDGKNLVRGFDFNNYIFPIGVRIDHQSIVQALNDAVVNGIITAEDRSHIVSYRIVRGNRVGNKSIDAKGLLFNMFQYDKFNEHYYFPNYSYNDLRSDALLNNVSLDAVNGKSQRFTFHSPETHFVNAGLGNILKLETEEHGVADGYFTHSECEAKQKFLSIFANTIAFGLGLAAALSATGEKSCKTITYIADYTTNVNDFPLPNGRFVRGTGRVSSSVKREDYDYTETHNNSSGSGQGFDPFSGAATNIGNFAQQEITQCKGQDFQLFILLQQEQHK